jgi:hypothetical protein
MLSRKPQDLQVAAPRLGSAAQASHEPSAIGIELLNSAHVDSNIVGCLGTGDLRLRQILQLRRMRCGPGAGSAQAKPIGGPSRGQEGQCCHELSVLTERRRHEIAG